MEHGFTRRHFDLLSKWGNHHYSNNNPEQVAIKEELAGAYVATERWVGALQALRFPAGRSKIRKATINQGQAFSPYTWAKIYPSPSAPKTLAYTVGIDTHGFIVKIDTVHNPPFRQQYEDLRGLTNQGAPFAEYLPMERGIAMSLEELTAWSAEAIDHFQIPYDELVERFGLGERQLTLTDERSISRDGFARWRKALFDGARQQAPVHLIPDGPIVVRQTRSGREDDADGLDLGIDPRGHTWAVQINEPREVGSHNSLSAIAINLNGERILLRQGFLRPNHPGGHTIKGDEFRARAGLQPLAVDAEGLAAKRDWYRVCNLEASAEQIRKDTAAFVAACAEARASANAGEPATHAEEAGETLGSPESGGSYLWRKQAAEERIVQRKHGEVWLALSQILQEAGLQIRKRRHRLGYEVDAEVVGSGIQPLLIEIKTSTCAGDVHTGVGQLNLYPSLMSKMDGHERVLLLPTSPSPDVQAAVESCGITIYTFAFGGTLEKPDVRFSPDLLNRCGLAVNQP